MTNGEVANNGCAPSSLPKSHGELPHDDSSPLPKQVPA